MSLPIISPAFYNRRPKAPGLYAYQTVSGRPAKRGWSLYRVKRGRGRGGPLYGQGLFPYTDKATGRPGLTTAHPPVLVRRLSGRWSSRIAPL